MFGMSNLKRYFYSNRDSIDTVIIVAICFTVVGIITTIALQVLV